MEYCYRLNLPPLESVLTTPISELLGPITNNTPKFLNRTTNIPIKPSMLNTEGFVFNQMFIFHKTDGYVGIVHRDSPRSLNPWGINWVHGGDSLMEYWDAATLPPPAMQISTARAQQSSNECNIQFELPTWAPPLTPPIKTYHMVSGVYLVNASLPHRATGYGSRTVVSLRAKEGLDTEWASVTALFTQLILPW